MKIPVFKLFWLLLCVLILEGCGERQGGKPSESQAQETLSYEIGDAEVTITKCDGAAAGDVVIPDDIAGLPVTSLGDSAFIGCTSLTSIIIPESVTSIEDFAFSGCRSLTSATIPDKVTSIGNYAFTACSSLSSLIIPESVTSIGNNAFAGTGLTSITIPDSVTSIGSSALWGCSSLSSITIPDSVTSIGESAFSRCTSLTEISVTPGNASYKSIDGVVFSKDDKDLLVCPAGKSGYYTVPKGVTKIGNYAFYTCNNLTSITIPESVTSIGDLVFLGCDGLTSINIPQTFHSEDEASRLGLDKLWPDGFALPDSSSK
jgi:hypothetical protein